MFVTHVELVNEKTTFGRKGDCNISDLIDNRLTEISNTHFSIIKNIKDHHSPVFLEVNLCSNVCQQVVNFNFVRDFHFNQDTSRNGTYFHEKGQHSDKRVFGNFERIDEKCKRRILAHKDVIYVEKRPSICFEFQSLQMSSNDLPDDINKDYHIGKLLGEGACGTVYFAQNRRTCQPFALKYTSGENDENILSTILKEVDILKSLKHPNILQLFKVQTYVNSVAIFLEFMSGGDLLDRIQKSGHFSESLSKFIFYQICCGIEYLHSVNVTHRDLKPDNILLATTDEFTLVKVSDFGLSKRVTTNTILKTQCGTKMYLAPEVRTANYTNKVDIWSLGVILYNCFTGRYPFKDADKRYPTFDQEDFLKVSEDGQNIVRETLRIEANQRPSASELINQRSWMSKSHKNIRAACEIMSNPIISK